jgi:hypothetical protein
LIRYPLQLSLQQKLPKLPVTIGVGTSYYIATTYVNADSDVIEAQDSYGNFLTIAYATPLSKFQYGIKVESNQLVVDGNQKYKANSLGSFITTQF